MTQIRLSSVLLCVMLIISTSTSSYAGKDKVHGRKIDSIKLIQKSYKNREINYRTALNYKIYSLFNKKMLPEEYQSEAPIKTATPTILEARESAELLYDENAFILQRPTEPDETDPGHYYGNGIDIWTYDSPGGNFKIHYTEDDSFGDAVYGYDGLQDTVPEYVTKLADYFDSSWNWIINSMDYPAPPSDGDIGGDGRIDIYLLDMEAYGYTAYYSEPFTAYIAVHNDFAGFPDNLDPEGNRTGSMKVTAAHEFFHIILFQYSTNLFSNGWWSEASATWMEDEVFPSVNDYLNYLGSKYDDANENGRWDSGETYYTVDGVTLSETTGRPERWFDHPEYSIDSTSGIHQYGTAIWAKYLSKRYGTNVVQSIWERIENGNNALTATSDEIVSQGNTLDTFFPSFVEANFIRDYPDAAYYPALKHEAAYSASETNISLSGTLEHLSSALYLIQATEASTILTLTFNNMHSGNLSARLILTTNTDEYEIRDISLDSYTVTTEVSDFGTTLDYTKASLVIMNRSGYSEDAYSVSINPGTTGGNDSGSDIRCFIATAAYGSYLAPHVSVLRQFRDSYLLTNTAGTAFVDFYYSYSPPLANLISKHKSLRKATRWCLTPTIYFIQYPLAGLLLFSMACISIPVLINLKRYSKRKKTIPYG